jgi:hypothetical protein
LLLLLSTPPLLLLLLFSVPQPQLGRSHCLARRRPIERRSSLAANRVLITYKVKRRRRRRRTTTGRLKAPAAARKLGQAESVPDLVCLGRPSYQRPAEPGRDARPERRTAGPAGIPTRGHLINLDKLSLEFAASSGLGICYLARSASARRRRPLHTRTHTSPLVAETEKVAAAAPARRQDSADAYQARPALQSRSLAMPARAL